MRTKADKRAGGNALPRTLGLAKRRVRFDELLPIAIDQKHATDRLRIGISPHAPFTVDLQTRIRMSRFCFARHANDRRCRSINFQTTAAAAGARGPTERVDAHVTNFSG